MPSPVTLGTPLRSSSGGVSSTPAATHTTRSVDDDPLRGVAAGVVEPHGFDAQHTAAAESDALGPGATGARAAPARSARGT